ARRPLLQPSGEIGPRLAQIRGHVDHSGRVAVGPRHEIGSVVARKHQGRPVAMHHADRDQRVEQRVQPSRVDPSRALQIVPRLGLAVELGEDPERVSGKDRGRRLIPREEGANTPERRLFLHRRRTRWPLAGALNSGPEWLPSVRRPILAVPVRTRAHRSRIQSGPRRGRALRESWPARPRGPGPGGAASAQRAALHVRYGSLPPSRLLRHLPHELKLLGRNMPAVLRMLLDRRRTDASRAIAPWPARARSRGLTRTQWLTRSQRLPRPRWLP